MDDLVKREAQGLYVLHGALQLPGAKSLEVIKRVVYYRKYFPPTSQHLFHQLRWFLPHFRDFQTDKAAA